MIDISKVKSLNQLQKNDGVSIVESQNDDDTSIFATQNMGGTDLEAKLDSVQSKNGFILKAWDSIKNFTNIGVSSEDCDDAIQKYKNGEISFEEADAKIKEYSQKQDSSLNLFSNIATGVAGVVGATVAAAAIVASGGTATLPVLAAVGAGAGALTKPTFKASDRATNEQKGDTLDAKQIAKDALSGAVTGGIGAATMGTGSAAGSLSTSVTKGALRSAKTGLITGSVSGSSNYLIDTAFEEDKKFNTKDFLTATASNALVGGAVGGIMGAANGAMKYSGIVKHGGNVLDNSGNFIAENASKEAIAANSICNAEYKVVADKIKEFAA